MMMKKDLNNDNFPGYYIAPQIKKMLDKAKYLVKHHDWDRVIIIDGEEGTGKSLLGLQIGYYLDPTLNLDRIVFNGEDFAKTISKTDKNKCIIFDEAFNGLSSTAALSKMNKLIVTKLMECRQKNLFIIIILPTIFLLQKYAAIFRSRALFHVYATSKGVRGYYRVYNRKNKKILYLSGNRFYSYSKPYMKKSYRFYGKYPLNEEEYREKKLNSLVEEEKIGKREKNQLKKLAFLMKLLKDRFGVTYKELSEILRQNNLPLASSNISRIVQNNL